MAQTSIKDTINRYSKVTGINARTVTVSNAAAFKSQDTVLLIQMTGILESGTIENAGRYEFHIVTAVNSNTVTLQSTPGAFNATTQLVQLIRVPSYRNAVVLQNNSLTCGKWRWSTGTGGVLALMVDETLTLNGHIDVSGRGFNGGAASGVYYGQCTFDPPYNSPDYTKNASSRAGNKGEGAVTTSYFNPGVSDSNIRGYGKTYNGGGGGNGQWSGGGGGANGGYAGSGGDQACYAQAFERSNIGIISIGNNGYPIKYGDIKDPSQHAFMGGGGGAGTGVGTPGGNGGGIVIIVAQRLEFNHDATIKANGNPGGDVPKADAIGSQAGAGGGGGGGSILLSAEEYSSEIKAEMTGGAGGSVTKGSCNNATYSIGVGGGGSGGFLFTTMDATQHKDWYEGSNFNRNGGDHGQISPSSCSSGYATPGKQGTYLGNFQVQMRGFLRNYFVSSSVSTCNGEPTEIVASQPQGGNGEYTYSWQTAPNSDGPWTTITGATGQNLTHSFTASTWVRRIVSSDGTVDTGSSIRVTVEAAINNEIAPADTTLCWQSSYVIRGNTPSEGGGGGPYIIQWQELINGTWTDIKGETQKNLEVSLKVSGGTQTYRREVTSGKACVSEGKTSVLRVQPIIAGNTITPGNQEVCEDHAEKLTGPAPTGGTGSYTYQWQVKTEGLDWTDITGATDKDYQPILNIPQIASINRYKGRYYQRYVRSDKCNSTSNGVMVQFDQQSSESIITTGDQTGNNALKYKFSEQLNAKPPVIGSGIWSSTDEKLGFNPPGEPTTTVSNLQLGMNTVIWTVSNGACVSEPASVTIEVTDIKIPSGFSPNDDGLNDCFRVVGGENATSSEITILDRYNNVVFESKSFMGGSNLDDCSGWWDGRTSSGKELPPGTYFYQLTLNGDKVYKGYVVLKKQ